MKFFPEKLKKALQDLKNKTGEALDPWMHRLGIKKQNSLQSESSMEPPNKYTPIRPLNSATITIHDEGETLSLVGELPDLQKEDFIIRVEKTRLFIQAEKKPKIKIDANGVPYKECRYGSFSKVIIFPCAVEASQTKAIYEKGILRLTLLKNENAKERYIKVKVE